MSQGDPAPAGSSSREDTGGRQEVAPRPGGTPTPSVLEQSEIDARATRAGRRRWLVGAGVIVALTVVAVIVWLLTSPVGVVARAVANTIDQGSARTAITATIGGVPLMGDVDLVVADGEVDFSTGEAVLRREVLGRVRTELRYDREGVFVQVPFADDRWVRLADEAEAPTAPGEDMVSVAPGIANPAAVLGLLQVLEEEPRELRQDRIGDDVVTVWEVIVNLDTAAGLLGEEAQDVVARLRRLAGGGELPLEVAIDEEQLVRSVRFSTEVQLPVPVTPRLDNRVTFDDFGVPVDVAPPPEDRLVDLDPSALTNLDPLAVLRDLLSGIPGL